MCGHERRCVVRRGRALEMSAVLMAVVACAGGDGTGPTGPELSGPQYTVTLSPSEDSLFFLGASVQITPQVHDSAGMAVASPDIEWATIGSAVGITPFGEATALEQGTALIVARSGRGADTATIHVYQVPAAMESTSVRSVLTPRGVVDLWATVVDSGGSAIPHASPTWVSSDPAVAEVRSGQAFGRALGSVSFTATVGDLNGEVATEVVRPSGGGSYRVWSEDGTVLAGTLDLPSDVAGPYPVMVRVHGSGPVTRQSGLFAAGTLLPAGIGIMRYDKRGVGLSGGEYTGVGPVNSRDVLPSLAADAAAWLEFLAFHEDVDPDRLGLLGVSQGGWINPIAASESPHARYMINVVGPTVTVGQQIFYQNLTQSSGNGQNLSGMSDAQLAELVRNYGGEPGFDPAPVLRSLDVPGLWVLGTKDYLVPYINTVEILEGIVEEHGLDYSVHSLLNGTHSTRDLNTGSLIPWWEPEGGGFDWLRARGLL